MIALEQDRTFFPCSLCIRFMRTVGGAPQPCSQLNATGVAARALPHTGNLLTVFNTRLVHSFFPAWVRRHFNAGLANRLGF